MKMKIVAVILFSLMLALSAQAQTLFIPTSQGALGGQSGITLGFWGSTAFSSGELTRTNNTTQYDAGDMIGYDITALSIPLTVSRTAGGSGYLTKFVLTTSNTNTAATIRLWFYSTTNVNIAAEHVAGSLIYTNTPYRIGYIDMPALATEGAGSTAAISQNLTDRLPFRTVAPDTKIYCYLQTKSVFTPAASQKFTVEVTAEQN